jgi:hypothetical protein
MKKLTFLLLAGMLASLMASAAIAGTPRIDRREAHQRERIRDGRTSGRLARGERVRLNAGQRHILRMERRAGRDGVFTRRERMRIERAQDRQSRRIWRLEHNRRVHI